MQALPWTALVAHAGCVWSRYFFLKKCQTSWRHLRCHNIMLQNCCSTVTAGDTMKCCAAAAQRKGRPEDSTSVTSHMRSYRDCFFFFYPNDYSKCLFCIYCMYFQTNWNKLEAFVWSCDWCSLSDLISRSFLWYSMRIEWGLIWLIQRYTSRGRHTSETWRSSSHLCYFQSKTHRLVQLSD